MAGYWLYPYRSIPLPALFAALATLSVASAQSNGDAYIVKIPSSSMASSVTLSTSGGAGVPGQIVEIPFSLSSVGTATPAAFQIDLTFDPQKLTFASARVGPQLAVNQALSSSVVSSGDVRLSTTGTNQAAISNGLVAYASFTLSPQFNTGSTPVTLVNCMATNTAGNSLATGCTAGTITMFTCDLNGDGAVNVTDVQLIINQALGIIPEKNDLNHDGIVNVADVQKEINAALGLGCPY